MTMVVISASCITRIDIIYYQYYKGGGNICIMYYEDGYYLYEGGSNICIL